MVLFVVTVFLSYILSVNLSYAVPFALKNIANDDGIISSSGCNTINGTMINKQVNFLKTRICNYDNYRFIITHDTHRGCVGSLGHWKDPENNKTFTFRSPCDTPNFALDEGLGFFFSPLKQIKLGIPFDQVTCSDHTLRLMTNPYSYTAICVKPLTAQKLVERGWSSLNEQTIWVQIKTIMCNPWDKDITQWYQSHNQTKVSESQGLEIIKNYYQKQGISVFNAKYVNWRPHTLSCDACGCDSGLALHLLVSNSDLVKLEKQGFSTVK